eukprot:TRINITY_DN6085_c0_g1_i1.p1 TRINITY_DN6085_c0_g1~~TRINITY_DN6085_c0_g1_i1.p1  ORF type:complete len:220 (-),score=50.89 TRINITY_DN6085_c0_g1_i1:19-600(-)
MIGYKAPSFSSEAVVNHKFETVSLDDYKGKWLVLLFYPLDFTFVCPTEIISFSDNIADFRELNAEVVALSVDSKYSHLAWVNTPRKDGGLGSIDIPLVSDFPKKIASDYGVLYKDEGFAVRGLFIIDPEQILRVSILHDPPVGRSVDETLRLLKAFQYADTHGEVCPANWRPGAATMTPEPLKSKEYFEKADL